MQFKRSFAMIHSRRDLGGFAMSLLAAMKAAAQSQSPTLKSARYRIEDRAAPIPGSFAHPIFNGELHSGFAVELHETELPAGEVPHPPHHHVHEEVILIREGTLEVTISGQSTRMNPGSVAFVASNEEHGWRNVGKTTARYFLFALGPDWNYRQNPSGVKR
jgi:quercetin dioxygenase-like cupin family protein